MKQALRAAAAHLLWRTGLARLARRLLVRRGRFVLELHGISSRRVAELPANAQPSLCRAELAALLGWLCGRFRFLTPEAFFNDESSEPGVLLTFDDGFANLATNALPLLAEHGAPAAVFVTTQHVRHPSDWLPATRRAAEQYPGTLAPELARDLFDGLSAGQLRAVAASPLVTVGSHSVSHPLLTRLPDAELARELADSKRFLEEVTGRPVDLFAYPTGDYDRRVMAAVRAAGYRGAFVEESRRLGGGLYEIPRLGVYSAEPAYLSVKLSGLFRRPLGGLRLADEHPS